LALTGGFLAFGVFVLALVGTEIATWVLLAAAETRGAAIVRDRLPRLTAGMVDGFYKHGFDAELGWSRKPNTSKKDLGRYPYSIDALGSRTNPQHEHLPVGVATFGDSYTFCREVEDHETWQAFLAEDIGSNVLNYGVGNYGLDQALLRLHREWAAVRAPFVIVGVVPQTIARNLSVWKHYNEFGNVLAFKPRFCLEEGRLRLVPNVIDCRDKFFRLEQYLDHFQQFDYFHHRRFKREAFRVPYLASAVVNWRAVALIGAKAVRRYASFPSLRSALSIVIDEHLDTGGVMQTVALFREREPVELFEALVDEYVRCARENGFFPVLAILPMQDDCRYIRRHGSFYAHVMERLRRRVVVVDAAPALLARSDVSRLFREWHYSPEGNKVVAATLAEALRIHCPQSFSPAATACSEPAVRGAAQRA
jgi:hypothetical protein